MKTKITILKHAFLMVIIGFSMTIKGYSQTLQTPSEGKSLVYFVRSNGTGALINFKFFDGEKYLGKFNGVKYFIYECDPGEHVFWASSENRSFVEAELESGKVYFMEVRPTPGAIKSAVKLVPISPDNEKGMKRINKFISKKAPYDLDSKDFSDEAEDLDFFIGNGMKKYNSDKEKDKNIAKMPSNYAIN
ncbi:hypothetical protein ACFSKL_23025 [Belliella marina]|uniref:DUF2846 domain-containing protein n=1 Tax=Belliella marina TaxID=1644146 RepID=A0ABW4VU72_9BACT